MSRVQKQEEANEDSFSTCSRLQESTFVALAGVGAEERRVTAL
jgi:hypothetical protein